MRDIEYRAYDKWHKEMHERAEMTYDYGCSSYNMIPAESFGELINNEARWEIMQYIGRKDKNGTKIFEDDIVKSAVSDDIPHGEIRYDDKLCKFYVSINDDYDIIDIDEYEPIAIGNKWEIDNE